MVKPAARREVVRHYQDVFAISERRACDAMGFGRTSHRYRSRRDPAVELRLRLKDLAESRVRYGYRRLHVLLRREGWPVNHKRIYRLYSERRAVDPDAQSKAASRVPLPIGTRRAWYDERCLGDGLCVGQAL